MQHTTLVVECWDEDGDAAFAAVWLPLDEPLVWFDAPPVAPDLLAVVSTVILLVFIKLKKMKN